MMQWQMQDPDQDLDDRWWTDDEWLLGVDYELELEDDGCGC